MNSYSFGLPGNVVIPNSLYIVCKENSFRPVFEYCDELQALREVKGSIWGTVIVNSSMLKTRCDQVTLCQLNHSN